ncbi:MAG: hypothetical protein HC836_10735 [Richelia sp. RM2_1_2]|nr:hypothetical protein [Richelia sp. RM2_1_2]
MVKINYLNNRELLKEIHNSKNSFCSFIDKQYAMYDAIVYSLDEITSDLIKETLISKAERLTKDKKYEQKESNIKSVIVPIDSTTLLVEELVFRVMTDEHIPYDQEKPIVAKPGEFKKTKLNFPPFKHFIISSHRLNRLGIYKELEFSEVGRSHWINGLNNGCFSLEHGTINRNLAIMFLKLVERYAQRGNWRGYCVDIKTEALTQRGWLTYDQINEDDIILSYENNELKWSKIKSIYRSRFDGLMHKITHTSIDALITPKHKLLTTKGLVEIEKIHKNDIIILMAETNNLCIKELSGCNFTHIIASELTYSDENYPFTKPTAYYNNIVWCPETEYGSFVARRNGKIYLTGNTYNEEMRGQALLQLSQVGLQFNEAKSANPFAYYTETINNSFTRVLNTEKKNQHIRDDLLIAHNSTPSFSRQFDHEADMKKLDGSINSEVTVKPTRRGRRPAGTISTTNGIDSDY